jgi:hypothetical protein
MYTYTYIHIHSLQNLMRSEAADMKYIDEFGMNMYLKSLLEIWKRLKPREREKYHRMEEEDKIRLYVYIYIYICTYIYVNNVLVE